MKSGIFYAFIAAVGLPATLLADVLYNKQTLILDGVVVSDAIELKENDTNMDSLRARKGHSSITGDVQLVGNLVRIRAEHEASLTNEGAIQGQPIWCSVPKLRRACLRSRATTLGCVHELREMDKWSSPEKMDKSRATEWV
jgi:hypothetical protein